MSPKIPPNSSLKERSSLTPPQPPPSNSAPPRKWSLPLLSNPFSWANRLQRNESPASSSQQNLLSHNLLEQEPKTPETETLYDGENSSYNEKNLNTNTPENISDDTTRSKIKEQKIISREMADGMEVRRDISYASGLGPDCLPSSSDDGEEEEEAPPPTKPSKPATNYPIITPALISEMEEVYQLNKSLENLVVIWNIRHGYLSMNEKYREGFRKKLRAVIGDGISENEVISPEKKDEEKKGDPLTLTPTLFSELESLRQLLTPLRKLGISFEIDGDYWEMNDKDRSRYRKRLRFMMGGENCYPLEEEEEEEERIGLGKKRKVERLLDELFRDFVREERERKEVMSMSYGELVESSKEENDKMKETNDLSGKVKLGIGRHEDTLTIGTNTYTQVVNGKKISSGIREADLVDAYKDMMEKEKEEVERKVREEREESWRIEKAKEEREEKEWREREEKEDKEWRENQKQESEARIAASYRRTMYKEIVDGKEVWRNVSHCSGIGPEDVEDVYLDFLEEERKKEKERKERGRTGEREGKGREREKGEKVSGKMGVGDISFCSGIGPEDVEDAYNDMLEREAREKGKRYEV